MIIKRQICPPGLKNNPNKRLTSISFITIHESGNYRPSATAASHASYIYNGSGGQQTSWHYTVDKSDIYQHFNDWDSCWHGGDGANGPGNTSSIGIEICVNDKAGFRQACANAAWLTAELLKRHNLIIDKVVQHFKWTGKNCPAELRSGAWGITWADFMLMVRRHMAPPAPPTSPGNLYRVQVGAYSVKANAEAMLAKLKASGFKDAVIKS